MSALEKIDTGGIGLPPALAGTGVALREQDGIRSVVFTEQVFRDFNVVSPTSEIAALDPMWRPSLAVIQLDPAQHGYAGEKKGETALAKNGILALADGAGIQIRTRRMPRSELRECEVGWTATALVRQSGGTLKELEQSKVIDLDHERELINDQVWKTERDYAQKDGRQPNAEAAKEKARQRWLKERPHMDAKCETKAMLRAIRAAMQLRHALPTAQFSKPWIVVRIGFSPDYDDPAVRQQVVAAGVGATAELYGTTPAGEIPAAADGQPEPPHTPPVTAGAEDEPEDVTDAHVVDDAGAGDGADAEYEQWRAEQAEQQAPADEGQTSSWQAVLDAAGATVVGFGKKYPGQTIAAIYAVDAPYLDWIVSSQFAAKGDAQERVKAHARDYLQAARALQVAPGTGGAS